MTNFPIITGTLRTMYGVSILTAPAIAILWAADCILDTEHAKRELREANDYRHSHGLVTICPSYGSRLF